MPAPLRRPPKVTLTLAEHAELKAELFRLDDIAPLMPRSLAAEWALQLQEAGYRDIEAKELCLLCWRFKVSLPVDRPQITEAAVKVDVRRIVRVLGYKLLPPGVAVQITRSCAKIAVLLQPKDGAWPQPEEFLPERFRQPVAPRDGDVDVELI